jgi:hypothetical protein
VAEDPDRRVDGDAGDDDREIEAEHHGHGDEASVAGGWIWPLR